ncbi:hypothetical protein MTO96_035705 [Rhipicephalus appendiculatus]
MASSQAILQGDHDDDDFTFWCMFAVQQEALRNKQAQMLRIIQQLEELEEEKEHSEQELNHLAVMAARLMLRERRVWTYARPESWFETTLPHLPASAFRENFRLNVSTFWLATSAEERTVANLFVVSRSSVNIIFREFCDVIVRRLEPWFVRFPRAQELAEYIRQFAAVAGIPQGELVNCSMMWPPMLRVFKVSPRCYSSDRADVERKIQKARLLNRKLTATLKRLPCVRILNAEVSVRRHAGPRR